MELRVTQTKGLQSDAGKSSHALLAINQMLRHSGTNSCLAIASPKKQMSGTDYVQPYSEKLVVSLLGVFHPTRALTRVELVPRNFSAVGSQARVSPLTLTSHNSLCPTVQLQCV
jgi:hypothetical protein